MVKCWWLFVTLLIGSHLIARPAVAQDGQPLRVSAAISLKQVLETIAKLYEKQSGQRVELAFGASGQLAAQIGRGAEVDLFVSAAQAQVDQLIKSKSADAADVRVLATNRLVLIVPANSHVVNSFADLASAKVRKVAAGEPRVVPAGTYAKQTVVNLKLFEGLENKMVYGANVRQVLDYVVRGEVDAGLVYLTDALQAGDKVKTVATADASLHDAIEYPAVIIAGTTRRDAAVKFLEFLQTDAARAEFDKLGFGTPAKPAAATRDAVAPGAPRE